MNKYLLRQLKRTRLQENSIPNSLEDWKAFLQIVSESYDQAEDGRYLLERSLEISSREMAEKIELNKQLGLKLAQAGKLASVGTLASGVAHELNNPLAGIKGYVELISQRSDLDQNSREKLGKVMKLVARMTSIINHLRKLSRDSSNSDRKLMSFLEPVFGSFELLRSKLDFENIKVTLPPRDIMIPVVGDAARLESVFQNLFTNSLDAFIERNISEPRTIEVSIGEESRGLIHISYIDNAGGIPTEILDRIFDPFFTTKQIGAGTGLGMSISHQVIQDHGGKISVVSSGDGKTRFDIALPIEENANRHNTLSCENIKKVFTPPSYFKKMLVIDDEEAILEFLKETLSPFFDVRTATSAEDAINILQQESFTIIVTDITLPGKSGIEIAEEARKIKPDIKIVFTSGFSHSEYYDKTKGFAPYIFLEKPFLDVKAVMCEILDFVDHAHEDHPSAA